MKRHVTVSIGYYRDDGDFRILATLSNQDEEFNSIMFTDYVEVVRHKISEMLHYTYEVVALEREDAPDYVTIENESDAA